MSDSPYQSPQSDVGRTSSLLGDMKLRSKSLFKLLFIGFLFGIGPIIVLSGVYDLITGAESMVSLNGNELSGVPGFLLTLIFVPVFAISLSVPAWVLISFGCWLYTRFWKLNLEFKE